MEFQPTPGTYAPVDPFKPSISFSIKKILGSHRPPQDDTDLNSPPPVIPTRRHGAIRPPTNTAFGPRYEELPDAWIPTASRTGLPPPHGLRAPRFELPPDNWIPQASDSRIQIPDPHEFQVQGDFAVMTDAVSINSGQRNTSHYRNSDFRSRPRSRSSSPSDRNRRRRRPRSPSLSLRDSLPRFGSSRANEKSRRKRNFGSRHQSRSPSPSVERNRERSPSQRCRSCISRSRSPSRSRTRSKSRSRSIRRSRCPSSGSDARHPMVLISASSSNSDPAAPRWVSVRLPPIITLPSSGVPELAPLPSSLPPSIIIQPSSALYEYPLSSAHEKTEASASVSSRRSAVSEPFDERRPVELGGSSESVHLMTYIAAFALDTLPRQLYLHFLLRLPYMYFSRVTRIFEEAEMSMPQIKQGILEAAIQLKEPVKDVADAWKLEPVESAQYSKLQNTWQSFIDSLMREWKTLNIISVLLLS